jgi:hypothetical protein
VRKFLVLFIMGVLIFRSIPPAAVIAQIPADCQICGHVCCCPAICEAKIKAQKKHSSGCGTSACRLDTSSSPRELASAKEFPAPSYLECDVFSAGLRGADNHTAPRRDVPFLSSLSLTFEIPTPPPRHITEFI